MNAAMNGTIRAGWDIPSTTISVGFVSRDQESAGIPIWEFHHSASKTFLGTRKPDRNSQYQIGSISKAFTDAVLIRSKLNLDDPITTYLPGLNGAPTEVDWDTITLRSLGSHLAGISPNCRQAPRRAAQTGVRSNF
jgi:actin-related protein 6